MLEFTDLAREQYDAIRDRRDRLLTDALEDALDLIESDPSSAKHERLNTDPTTWITKAPQQRTPLLKIYWKDAERRVIVELILDQD